MKKTEFNQQCSSRRTSWCIIEKHDGWDGWRYHWRQRYWSLGLWPANIPEKNSGILVEIWNRFLLTLWWKTIFKTWCSTTQKRRKLVTEISHKSYSWPEPQWRRSWQKPALFFSSSNSVLNVSLVDWCAWIRLNVRISILEKESSTGSKLLSAWGATSIQWSIKMPRLHLAEDAINHYEELIQN